MANLPKGTQVQQIVTPISGTVEGYQVDQETGDVQYLVTWTDADGDECSRYFKADEIEAVAE